MIELLGKNRFRWRGRWSNVINSGGIKLYPEYIEGKVKDLIADLEPNLEFFFAGMPDSKYWEKLIMVCESSLALNKEALFKLLKLRLPKYEIPKEIYVLSTFKKTPTQKINRIETLKLITP